jgi:phospholipid transport system substrate-binding protein
MNRTFTSAGMPTAVFSPVLRAVSLMIMLITVALPASMARADARIDAASGVITAMVSDMDSYLATDAGDASTRLATVTRMLDTYFDLPTIARFSVGPYWRAASDEERQTYNETLRLAMIGTVVNNFDQLKGLTFTPTDSLPKGDNMVLVRGHFSDKSGQRSPVMVGWRVITPDNGRAKVLDVEIENISMLVTQQQENLAIIRQNQGRFGALIEAMKAKQTTN